MAELGEAVLEHILATFRRQRDLGAKALQHLSLAQLTQPLDAEDNLVAIIVKHLHGNMRSRWRDFLTSDGEKPDRQRDGEFESEFKSKEEILALWAEGWSYVFTALEELGPADLERTVTIRTRPLSVLQALLRQLDHYAYHVGQIVLLAKHHRGEAWESLSIPKGESSSFNQRLSQA